MTSARGHASHAPSMLPVGPGSMVAVQRVLSHIDELPAGASGALHFGEQGAVLVQARNIVWIKARGARQRLTDILRHQTTPPIPREVVEAIYRDCRVDGTPIGEALVRSGLASEAGLRAALAKHNGEALAVLAASGAGPSAFVTHARTGYDRRYAFATCELLALLGASDDPAGAAVAQHELRELLVPESTGVAFARGGAASGVSLIAVDGACSIAVRDLLALSSWSAGLMDLAHTCDAKISMGRVAWGSLTSLVTWRLDDLGFLALCSSRAAAARLVTRLAERSVKPSGVVRRALPQPGESA